MSFKKKISTHFDLKPFMTSPYTFSDCIFGFLRQFPFQKCILLWGLDVKQQKYTKLKKNGTISGKSHDVTEMGPPQNAWPCVSESQSDINRIESLQLQMARYILKAPRNTPREALYGELGWTPMCVGQNVFRVKYLSSILNMKAHRWPKLLLNAMLCLNCDFNTLRFRFLNCVKKSMTSFGLEHIMNDVCTNGMTSNPYWANPIKKLSDDIFAKQWYEEMCQKSSLTDYVMFKNEPVLECYLLDSTDFNGACLKFKLRSNTLPLDRRISRWTPDNDGTCKLCNKDIEDIRHFLFICDALKEIRIDEFKKLESELMVNNCTYIWEMFISSNLDVKLCLTLGSPSNDLYTNIPEISYAIFDQFCKSYAKRAWMYRTELRNNIT